MAGSPHPPPPDVRREFRTYPVLVHPDVSALSHPARVAIALHLFRGYCDCRGLNHPEIDRFTDYLWAYLAVLAPTEFDDWLKREPHLFHADYDDPEWQKFAPLLATAVVSESEFLDVLTACTEVLLDGMYGGPDEPSTRNNLNRLATIAVSAGACWPNLAVFAHSRWAERHGNGQPLTHDDLATWRAAEPIRGAAESKGDGEIDRRELGEE